MNTGAVVQAIASGDVADRLSSAGRQEREAGGERGFRDLLLEFANSPGAGPGEGEGGVRQPASQVGDFLDWLRNYSGMIGLGPRGDDRSPSGEKGGEMKLDGLDVKALVEALNTGDGAAALAALAGRAAGEAIAADPAVGQGVRRTSDASEAGPEEIILAALAGAAGSSDGEPVTPERRVIDATVTVLGRETHLAPPETVQSASAPSQWAVELAVRRSLAALPPAAPEVAPPLAGAKPLPGVSAVVSAPPSGVSATADAQLGSDGFGNNAPPRDEEAAPILVTEAGGALATSGASADANLPSGLMQQIASRVAGEAGATYIQEARPAAAPAFAVRPDSAVKVLHLQLQPAELGTVSIRMSVKDNTLRLDLEVGRGDTAHLIQRERETLSALLRSAGYSIDGLDIRIAEQPTGGQGGNGQSGLQMQGGQSGSSQPDTRLPGERSQEERRGSSHGNRGNRDEEQANQASGSGGIYL